MITLSASCHAKFGWYPWKAGFFVKGNGRLVNLVGRAGDEKEQGEEEGGSCVWDVLYESKINLKKKKKMEEGIWGTERKGGKGWNEEQGEIQQNELHIKTP